MTHLDTTHKHHQPTGRPTHTLAQAVHKARQIAHTRDEPVIVYYCDDYHTYSWLPEYDYHHDPDYHHIEEQDLYWHSDDGYYARAQDDDTMLEDAVMENWADVDNWTFQAPTWPCPRPSMGQEGLPNDHHHHPEPNPRTTRHNASRHHKASHLLLCTAHTRQHLRRSNHRNQPPNSPPPPDPQKPSRHQRATPTCARSNQLNRTRRPNAGIPHDVGVPCGWGTPPTLTLRRPASLCQPNQSLPGQENHLTRPTTLPGMRWFSVLKRRRLLLVLGRPAEWQRSGFAGKKKTPGGVPGVGSTIAYVSLLSVLPKTM